MRERFKDNKKVHQSNKEMRTILLFPPPPSSSSLTLIIGVVFCVCLCTTSALPSISMAKPNCPEKCGNITIPYPFGIGSSCSANSHFLVICQNSTKPPMLFSPSINMEVTDIWLSGTIVVKYPVTPMNCTNVQKTASIGKQFVGSPFTISAVRNSFAVIGCRNSVLLSVNETVLTGCTPTCRPNYEHESCNGINCCQTYIPRTSHELKYSYQSIREGNTGFCGYAFPVDNRWFGKEYESYKGFQNNFSNPFNDRLEYVPLVLHWELAGANISEYAQCDTYDSGRNYFPHCSSPYIESFYGLQIDEFPCYAYGLSPIDGHDDYQPATSRCSCNYGFDGNPYLDEGCVDIDECEVPNQCPNGRTCINHKGDYECFSDAETDRDGSSNNRARNIALITIGSLLGAGIFVLVFIGAWKSIKIIVKRFQAHQRRKFFKRNGGLLLEQKLSSTGNGYKKSKLFTAKELTQATDHYSESRVLGRGGQGTVYKGMLTDGSIVAVKKSTKVHESDIAVFINEVVILSQINHRNIVKLLGCCLETEVPLLVYEFVPNGTLFQHVHDPSDDFPLTWEMRLRIASEVAGALSYLHSSASAPIFHRDIKSTNVLLDEKYRAKVSDFGTSRSLSIDQTHFTTRVMGTFGYLDPEYFQSNRFTEKSDVYSFGVVMVELLTGEKAISSLRSAATGRSLAAYFLHSMEEEKLFDVVDARILEEGKREEIVKMAELSRRCLHLNGKLRPKMRQVANELESIQIKKSSSVLEQKHGCDDGGGFSDPTESYTECSSILSLTLER